MSFKKTLIKFLRKNKLPFGCTNPCMLWITCILKGLSIETSNQRISCFQKTMRSKLLILGYQRDLVLLKAKAKQQVHLTTLLLRYLMETTPQRLICGLLAWFCLWWCVATFLLTTTTINNSSNWLERANWISTTNNLKLDLVTSKISSRNFLIPMLTRDSQLRMLCNTLGSRRHLMEQLMPH